jgi:hypothetical protein
MDVLKASINFQGKSGGITLKLAQRIELLLTKDGAEFVAEAFRELLGREPNPGGLDYFTKSLKRGTPKITIIAQILNSPEAKYLLSS